MSIDALKNQLIMTAWVARDDDGALYMYKVKPYRCKGDYEGCWDSNGDTLALDNSLFQSVTWESEPLEVTISIIPNKKQCKH